MTHLACSPNWTGHAKTWPQWSPSPGAPHLVGCRSATASNCLCQRLGGSETEARGRDPDGRGQSTGSRCAQSQTWPRARMYYEPQTPSFRSCPSRTSSSERWRCGSTSPGSKPRPLPDSAPARLRLPPGSAPCLACTTSEPRPEPVPMTTAPAQGPGSALCQPQHPEWALRASALVPSSVEWGWLGVPSGC